MDERLAHVPDADEAPLNAPELTFDQWPCRFGFRFLFHEAGRLTGSRGFDYRVSHIFHVSGERHFFGC